MCGPAAASLAVQGAGAVSSAFGAAMSASSQKLGLKMDAFIARANARIADDNARFALQRGQQEEQRLRLSAAQMKSSQRAAMGANNVDMSTGSALNRQVSTDYLEEVDAKTIKLNAVREAMGYRNEAASQRMRATMASGAAKGISPFLTGATSLLGSASKVASNWYTMKEAGLFDRPGSQPVSQVPFGSGAELERYGTLHGGGWGFTSSRGGG